MMKKLLVLALLLSIATVANATLVISEPPAWSLWPSDNVIFTISGDGADQIGMYLLAAIGPGTLTPRTLYYNGNASTMYPIEDPALADAIEAKHGLGRPGLPVIGMELVDTVIPPAVPLPLDGVLADVLFHCDGAGFVTLLLLDGDLNLLDSIQIIQGIPEPATMLLFGLGGLFLRRKK